jgi:AraC-like DNA-binding protein
MNNYHVNFPDIGKEESLLNRGTVQKLHIDSGLNMRVWNLNFAQAITLSKVAEPIHSQFYLIYILTPESVALTNIDHHLQYNKYRERHALLIPDNVSAQFNVKAHRPVQIIEFNIATWWLKELLAGKKTYDSFASLYSDPDFKTVYIESGSWQMNSTAAELFQQTHAGFEDHSAAMPASLSIITSFIEKAFSSQNNNAGRVKDIYHSKMEEAEKILIKHLRNRLPNLSQIARQLAISESTLKRHFKLVYGKSIYGYYLARKMELGRQLLEENPSSVNEMAEMLGYEKVSYFIEIFKKYHGFSPGEINRRRKSA